MASNERVPKGDVFEFTMESKDSKIYTGIAREPNTFAVPNPADPNKVIVNSYPAPYTRRVAVYVPKQYVPGTEAPFVVGADGPDPTLFAALDNLNAEHRVPVMTAISIGNGSGDAQGSERGLEYDTMSGLYAEFVEKEVLPLVEKKYNVRLTKDPDGRATTGCSSGSPAGPPYYGVLVSIGGDTMDLVVFRFSERVKQKLGAAPSRPKNMGPVTRYVDLLTQLLSEARSEKVPVQSEDDEMIQQPLRGL